MDLDVNLELDKDLRETQRRPHCQDELRGEADCSVQPGSAVPGPLLPSATIHNIFSKREYFSRKLD